MREDTLYRLTEQCRKCSLKNRHTECGTPKSDGENTLKLFIYYDFEAVLQLYPPTSFSHGSRSGTDDSTGHHLICDFSKQVFMFIVSRNSFHRIHILGPITLRQMRLW